jgi:mono/diheme cytochrome c family protein
MKVMVTGPMTDSVRSIILVTMIVLLLGVSGTAGAEGDAKHGDYLVTAAGCISCHTGEGKDAPPFAGGRALSTPFGTFYGPNITPHREKGIGRWKEADFIRAMRSGARPDGAALFPAFPYPSYTKITDGDLRDMWAYLRTLTPDARTSQTHDLGFFFRWRFTVRGWKWLFFTPGEFKADGARPPKVNRGAYIVQALSHCGECHTPRNRLGAPRKDRYLAGGIGPDGKNVPNLTPTRLKKWNDQELQYYLTTGITPDGDTAGGAMTEVIRNMTGRLVPDDLTAVVAYLRSLPPIENDPR